MVPKQGAQEGRALSDALVQIPHDGITGCLRRETLPVSAMGCLALPFVRRSC